MWIDLFSAKIYRPMGVEKEKNQSFWTSLTGLCTGAATLITAIGGFLVVYTDRCSSGTKVTQAASVQEKEPVQIPVNPAPGRSSRAVIYPGRYPQASSRLLTQEDLQFLSRQELRLMRNEIFARHGMMFRSEDLRSYFNSQPWYVPKYDEVSAQITGIEKQNIELIKLFE